MKKVILIAVMMLAVIGLQAQTRWSQFAKVTRGKNVTEFKRAEGDKHFDWYIKPAAQLTGYALQWNSTTKIFDSKQLAAYGLGVATQHYTERNGVLVPDYSVNGMLILNLVTPDSPGLGFAFG